MPRIYLTTKVLPQIKAELDIEPEQVPPFMYRKDGKAISSEGLYLFPSKEAIKILDWRAKREFQIDHHYEQNILSVHKERGALHPYFFAPGSTHNCLYSLGELVRLHIQPRRAKSIAATKRGEQEARGKKADRTLTGSSGIRQYGTN